MNTPRTRYQQGSLTYERRRNGTVLWLYRWREVDGSGNLVRRNKIVGTKKELPTRAAALRAVDGLKTDMNAEAATAHLAPMSMTELIGEDRPGSHAASLAAHDTGGLRQGGDGRQAPCAGGCHRDVPGEQIHGSIERN
jgi:hypothetical protein